MLLVIPVSHVDLDRAAVLAQRIAKFGGMGKEIVMVSATWRAAWDIKPVLEALAPAFQHTLFHKLETENEMGWPDSANHLFYETAKYLDSLNLADPWYYMEADCSPLRPGWFTALTHEHATAGKPYTGATNDSRWLDQRTQKVTIRGRHMVGTAIYPPDFLKRCKLVHELDIVPWDVAIGSEIIGEVHDTKLISHHWGCQNARREVDGLIYCDSIDPTKKYNEGVIPAEAVVCHGIKDGSLDRLLDNPPITSDAPSTMRATS